MANTTPYNLDGTIKRKFFAGAGDSLVMIRQRLLDFQKKFATLTKTESTVAGLLGELNIMLRMVAQQELDQNEDIKLRRARDKVLLSKGFPAKKTPYQKLHERHKAKRKN